MRAGWQGHTKARVCSEQVMQGRWRHQGQRQGEAGLGERGWQPWFWRPVMAAGVWQAQNPWRETSLRAGAADGVTWLLLLNSQLDAGPPSSTLWRPAFVFSPAVLLSASAVLLWGLSSFLLFPQVALEPSSFYLEALLRPQPPLTSVSSCLRAALYPAQTILSSSHNLVTYQMETLAVTQPLSSSAQQ